MVNMLTGILIAISLFFYVVGRGLAIQSNYKRGYEYIRWALLVVIIALLAEICL